MDEPPSVPATNELLRRVAATGSAVTVHAEDPTAFDETRGVADAPTWDAARPAQAEERAFRLLGDAPPSLRIHLAHVTTIQGLGLVRERGWSCEATAHHLLLSSNLAPDPRWKVNPPLRSRDEGHRLWERFANGEVTSLASDHAPHSFEAKRGPWASAPSGMPGVETSLPLMLARVRDGDLDLGALVASACDHPARWMGLPMGRLAPGHRGHLIVVDFKRLTRVQSSQLHAPCGWTAFEGHPAVFPVEHYHDGERILEDGEYIGRLTGRVVRPEYAPDGSASNGVEA